MVASFNDKIANEYREKEMNIMKRLMILMLLVPLAAFCAQLSLTLENDCFLPDKRIGKGDHDYTHGTGVEYVSDGLMHLKAGQNMYAPSDLKRSDHIKGDRPYAGIIYAGVGYEFFRDYAPHWTHYGEIDFGMVGPAAFCGHTQKLIHKMLNCKDPKGWHNQLHNEIAVNCQWWEKYNWHFCRYAALVPRVGVLAGNVEDAVEAGCDLKVGWNIKNDVGSSIMFSAANGKGKSWLDDLQAYVYAGADERFYLYNHFLQGSFLRSKDRDQGLDVEMERLVAEVQCGAYVQFKSFYAKYYVIFRQHEFEHQQHSPNYAGMSFGWCW